MINGNWGDAQKLFKGYKMGIKYKDKIIIEYKG